MPGEASTQKEGATTAASLDTFEFKSIEHLSRLDYQRPSSGEVQSVAIRFFGGDGAHAGASAPEHSTTDDTVDLDDGVDGFYNPRSDLAWPAFDWDDGSDSEEDLAAILKKKLDKSNSKLASADRKLETAMRKLALTRRKLEQAREQGVPTLQELALAKQKLELLHKQSMHSSQELAAAVAGMQSTLAGRYRGESTRGSLPFLAHYGSAPLIEKRIEFERGFQRVPRVIVGLQTGDAAAMALVCALDVDREGFTVHADLANRSDFADRTELMKCLVSWIAFEDDEAEEGADAEEGERALKRQRVF